MNTCRGVLEVLILKGLRGLLSDAGLRAERLLDQGEAERVASSETWGMIAWEWITVKAQYCVLSFRNETREVEWIEAVGGNLGVW